MADATQDRLEDWARELGWRVVKSNAEVTVLESFRGRLTVEYSLRERDGVVHTVTRNIKFEANATIGSFHLGETALMLVDLKA
ncbi:hypothetical protein SEA_SCOOBYDOOBYDOO_62 [Mycobacterium phage ScoobyDoobyDoo]|nr:hypothetical protein SEA_SCOOBYDOOBYDOO_62 [Mycobacterium phage ScoobyDoobyDoo]